MIKEKVDEWKPLHAKRIMDWIIWGGKDSYKPDYQDDIDNLIDNEIKEIELDNI